MKKKIISLFLIAILIFIFFPKSVSSKLEDLKSSNNIEIEIIHRNKLSDPGTVREISDLNKINSLYKYLNNYKIIPLIFPFNIINLNNKENYTIIIRENSEELKVFSIYNNYIDIVNNIGNKTLIMKYRIIGNKIDFKELSTILEE